MLSFIFFFFNDTATTEIYTLSLHDALPILGKRLIPVLVSRVERLPDALAALQWIDAGGNADPDSAAAAVLDRKSTRLNSSHANISYAVFCLKKKKKNINHISSCYYPYSNQF